MPIEKPGKRPFAPWARRRRGQGERRVRASADLLLTPLVDMLVILAVFLLMSFSHYGELICLCREIDLPWATVTGDLERAPIIRITADLRRRGEGGCLEGGAR